MFCTFCNKFNSTDDRIRQFILYIKQLFRITGFLYSKINKLLNTFLLKQSRLKHNLIILK